MKKTILVSALTTLATMFVVGMLMHMCKSHCGQSKCEKTSTQCSSSYGHGDYSSCKGEKKCSFSDNDGHFTWKSGEKSICAKVKSCSSKSKCSKTKKCDKSKSKCSKKKSCDKSKWTVSTKDGVTTKTYESDDDGKVIKKVIKVKVDEEK
jgi:hypothetical protein